MARLSVHIPVFIACASDVVNERDVAKKEIEKLRDDIKWNDLHLSTFHWGWDSRTTVLRTAQPSITEYLKKCELAIIIFGNKLGSPIALNNDETGMQHELRVATEKVMEGTSDDVLLYFKKNITNEELIKFKESITEKRIFYFEYTNEIDFQEILSSHLKKWVDRWKIIPHIVEYSLKNSDKEFDIAPYLAENKLIALNRSFNVQKNILLAKHLGKQLTQSYQELGPEECFRKIIKEERHVDYSPFINIKNSSQSMPLIKLNSNQYKFSNEEWFYYFCAIGLETAILENDTSQVSNYPYINPIHQYLALRITGSSQHSFILRNWLLNKDRITKGFPIARNFAAYVLGMIQAKEAEDDLAFAAQNDSGEDVRIYSVMSLGRLKSRRHLELLVSLWLSPSIKHSLKLFISQSISNIIGITTYPL